MQENSQKQLCNIRAELSVPARFLANDNQTLWQQQLLRPFNISIRVKELSLVTCEKNWKIAQEKVGKMSFKM